MDGEVHDNKMERLTVKFETEKVMRGLKKPNTPLLKGYQIYHNFIRTHSSLNGLTPSEVAGIKVEGENQWITLIQNATEVAKKA